MVWTYTLDDLRNTVGEAGNLAKDLAKKVTNQYCKIRQKYPNLTRTAPPIQQFWDDYCSDDGVPPAPPPVREFEGGQCSGDTYKVTIDRVRNGADPCNINGYLPDPAILFVVGAVYGLRAVPTGNLVYTTCDDPNYPPAPDRTQYVIYLASETYPDYRPESSIIFFADFPTEDLRQLAQIIDIENLTNPDDLCGNPDAYPPDPIIDPQDFTTNYTFNQQTTNEIINQNYTINFSPTNVNLDSQIDVDINADIGIDNSTESFNFSFNDNSVTFNRRGGGGGGGNGDGSNTPSPNTEPSINFRPPGSGGAYDEEGIEDVTETEPEPTEQDIAFVLIDVVIPPTGHKTILFSDPENNTFFAGYIAWIQIIDGKKYRYPEIPIRKTFNIFEAPLGTKTFKAYTVNGAEISVKILRQPTEQET